MTETDDPLGVLSSTRRIVELATAVRIEQAAVEAVAARIAAGDLVAPAWDASLHWQGDRFQTANYILVLDALNFCFWGEPRWTVTFRGQRYDGYWALAAALTRALDAGVPLYDAAFLARLDAARLGSILAGEHEIPLLSARVANLREVGMVLAERYDGQFAHLIQTAAGDAVRLVQTVVREFSSFDDVAWYAGLPVRLYKRAQILVSDLYGACASDDLGAFHNLHRLTAFADYKVPQVLRHLGILRYADALRRAIDARVELLPGSSEEVEIRAATIWAVEELRRALERLGLPLRAFEIDWALWQLGQGLPAAPYHRTRTIFY